MVRLREMFYPLSLVKKRYVQGSVSQLTFNKVLLHCTMPEFTSSEPDQVPVISCRPYFTRGFFIEQSAARACIIPKCKK
jgi:hypothetical protein